MYINFVRNMIIKNVCRKKKDHEKRDGKAFQFLFRSMVDIYSTINCTVVPSMSDLKVTTTFSTTMVLSYTPSYIAIEILDQTAKHSVHICSRSTR